MIRNRLKSGVQVLAFLAATAGLAVVSTAAKAETPLKFVLNWKYEGAHGLFFLAEDRGYFKEEGLTVTIDQGSGSSAGIPLVANGAYDVAFGDINALTELAAKNPENAPVAVFMVYSRPPFTLAVKADSPIKSPADFAGRTLGAPASDGAIKLLPALCSITKVDCSSIKITNMQPNLREQMLMQGQVDGVFGYVNTIRFSAKLMGIDTDKDLRFIKYGDYGMDLYSNAIIVSRKLVDENPEAVKGLVRALNRSVKDAVADPEAAIASLKSREPLIKTAVERERFDSVVKEEIDHDEIARIGFGDVDDARLAKSIEIVAEAKALPRKPAPSEIFNRSFLPAKSDRLSTLPR